MALKVAETVPGAAARRGARVVDVTGGRVGGVLRYLRRNPTLVVGILLLLSLLLFSAIGQLTYDTSRSRPLSVPPSLTPSAEYPFGSDNQGRDLFAVMILGVPLTFRVGLLAGILGVGIGTVLAFVAAYYGGVLDVAIRGVVDIGLTVPGLLVLVIIAVMVKGSLSVDQMALVIASLAWLWPTRTIRSQVLTMRSLAYVQVARLSGMSGPAIIFREMLPNLLPYLGASLVSSTAAAVLASIGMTIYWVIYNSALLQGMWWWFAPPLVVVIVLFLGLFSLSAGLDEVANPRLRQSA